MEGIHPGSKRYSEFPYSFVCLPPPLAERNANHIGVSLAYACRYWADHLSLVALPKNLTENCVRMVDEVVRTRLLYWIEALSLLGDIYVAMPSIAEVGHWYSVCLQRILH